MCFCVTLSCVTQNCTVRLILVWFWLGWTKGLDYYLSTVYSLFVSLSGLWPHKKEEEEGGAWRFVCMKIRVELVCSVISNKQRFFGYLREFVNFSLVRFFFLFSWSMSASVHGCADLWIWLLRSSGNNTNKTEEGKLKKVDNCLLSAPECSVLNCSSVFSVMSREQCLTESGAVCERLYETSVCKSLLMRD